MCERPCPAPARSLPRCTPPSLCGRTRVDVCGATLQVRDSTKKEVKQTDFMTPSAFIFLYENQLFLTFRNRAVSVWNFRGELVTR